MIIFQNDEYKLFFSNKLPPLLALNYADEIFFKEFESLLGKRYRILSIIRKGWQRKHGKLNDINKLKKQFETKLNDLEWPDNLFNLYETKSKELKSFLELIKEKNYSKLNNSYLANDIKEVRKKSAILDAMTNMFHLFSSLLGEQFYKNLECYSSDTDLINQNLIFYTQPIKESKYAKIKLSNLENNFTLNKKDSNFSKLLRIGAYVNDDVSELLNLRKDIMSDLFFEISKRLNCDEADLDYLQISEIEEFLKTKKDSLYLIGKRRKLTILHYSKDDLEIYEGSDAEEFLKKGNFKETLEKEKNDFLKGQIASLGLAKGQIVIGMTTKEAEDKMKKGAILVAPYTAVEYLSSMKKAAAIITEVGGITSHAAIVSRELSIPCIVGVQNATKILKDGQLVEINANKGLIKLLD